MLPFGGMDPCGTGANIWCWDGAAPFWPPCGICLLDSPWIGPTGPPPGPEGAPSGILEGLAPWLASKPPGLCIVPGKRFATGWWMGMDPALL